MRTTAAITLEVVFAVLAFGVRSVVQVRRTGSSGFVLPRRGAPLVERIGALLFIASIVLLVIAPFVGPDAWGALSSDAATWIGAALAVAGIALCFAAQLTMGDSWRIGVDQGERTALVTAGVFGSVRNPIFTSMVIATVGFSLMLPNLVTVAALVTLVIGLELQVRYVEEPYLARAHGAAYRQYASAAGRFVPRLGTLDPIS